MTATTLFEKIWERTRSSRETPEHAGGAVRRPAPDPRGHVAAGVRGAARARPQGAPADRTRRDDGPLDADRRRRSSSAACRSARDAARSSRASSRRTAPSSASSCSASTRRARGIVHIIGPELGRHAARQDHRLRRQPHEHPRRLRRARLRHRHDRGRPRARDAVPAAAQAEDARGQRRGHARAGRRPPRTSSSRSSRELGVGGGTGHVIEYRGAAIRALSMEERMTVCNMSIEAGARAGHRSRPDETTFAYLKGRPRAPAGRGVGRAPSPAGSTLPTDAGARFDREIGARRGAARADDHLRHQPRHGRSPSTGTIPLRAGRRVARQGARVHGPRARRAACSARRSTSCSSAAAPTRASRTSGPRPRVLQGPQRRQGRARCSSCRARSAIKRQAEARGPRPRVHRRRRRVARVGLLDVPRHERRPVERRRILR